MMDDRAPPPADYYLLQLAGTAARLGISSIWESLGDQVHSELQRNSTATAPSEQLPPRSRAVPSGHARPSSRATPPSRDTVFRPERDPAAELRAPSGAVPARPSSGAASIDAMPALEPALPGPTPSPSYGVRRRSSQPASRSSRSSRESSTAAASLDAPRRLDFDQPDCATSGPAASSPATPWHGPPPPPPPIDADRVWPDRAEVAQRQGAVVGADAGVFEVPMQLSNLTMGGKAPRSFNLPRGARKVGQLNCKRPGTAAHSAVYLVVGGGGPRRIVDATGRALSPSVGWQALMPTHRLGLECDEYVQVSRPLVTPTSTQTPTSTPTPTPIPTLPIED